MLENKTFCMNNFGYRIATHYVLIMSIKDWLRQ